MNKQKGFQKRLRAFLEPFFTGGEGGLPRNGKTEGVPQAKKPLCISAQRLLYKVIVCLAPCQRGQCADAGHTSLKGCNVPCIISNTLTLIQHQMGHKIRN